MKSFRTEQTLLLVLVSAVLMFANWHYVHSLPNLNSDFFTFWLAGRMNWSGENPYSSIQWIYAHREHGVTWIPNQIFPYPIPLALFLAPIGLLPLREAFVVWLYLSEIAIVLSLSVLVSSQHRLDRQALVAVLAGAFLFRPVILTLANGQLSAFLLLTLTLVLRLWNRQKWQRGGYLLALLWLKPTIGGLIFLMACFYLWIERRTTVLITSVAVSILLVFLGMIRDPNWMLDFLASGGRKLSETFGTSPSYWGLAGITCNGDVSCSILVGVLLSLATLSMAGYVIWRRARACSPMWIVSAMIPVALLLTPYGWAYDHILLIIPLSVVILKMTHEGFTVLATSIVFLCFAVLSWLFLALAFVVGHDVWSLLVPLACLLLILGAMKPAGPAPIDQNPT